MAIVAKRTVMSLYSNAEDIYSHQVRIVLAEKGVNVEINQVEMEHQNEDLLEINPYGSIPTLIDRDLVLYEARIIMEYLDERFPHPPLLPVYPVARAESRKMMFRVETDWYSLMQTIVSGGDNVEQARDYLRDSFLALEPVFADKPYFLSEEFSLIDCVIAPLMWRFPVLGIDIPEEYVSIHQYMNRIFQRDSFQNSLTEAERQLRVA